LFFILNQGLETSFYMTTGCKYFDVTLVLVILFHAVAVSIDFTQSFASRWDLLCHANVCSPPVPGAGVPECQGSGAGAVGPGDKSLCSVQKRAGVHGGWHMPPDFT
jgi:hypothetical protein